MRAMMMLAAIPRAREASERSLYAIWMTVLRCFADNVVHRLYYGSSKR